MPLTVKGNIFVYQIVVTDVALFVQSLLHNFDIQFISISKPFTRGIITCTSKQLKDSFRGKLCPPTVNMSRQTCLPKF